MNPTLSSVSDEVLLFVEDQLSNDDVASDEELHRLFITNGLTDAQATQALRYRSDYLLNIYLEGHMPIRAGDKAVRFDPHLQQFDGVKR